MDARRSWRSGSFQRPENVPRLQLRPATQTMNFRRRRIAPWSAITGWLSLAYVMYWSKSRSQHNSQSVTTREVSLIGGTGRTESGSVGPPTCYQRTPTQTLWNNIFGQRTKTHCSTNPRKAWHGDCSTNSQNTHTVHPDSRTGIPAKATDLFSCLRYFSIGASLLSRRMQSFSTNLG